jgi:hypothetical protein
VEWWHIKSLLYVITCHPAWNPDVVGEDYPVVFQISFAEAAVDVVCYSWAVPDPLWWQGRILLWQRGGILLQRGRILVLLGLLHVYSGRWCWQTYSPSSKGLLEYRCHMLCFD